MDTLTSPLITEINEAGEDAGFFFLPFFVHESSGLTFSPKYLTLPLFLS